jgi:hypothetical protein
MHANVFTQPGPIADMTQKKTAVPKDPRFNLPLWGGGGASGSAFASCEAETEEAEAEDENCAGCRHLHLSLHGEQS